jgi:hypothetical protein
MVPVHEIIRSLHIYSTGTLIVKMLLEIIIFMRGNPKLGPFEGVGNENLDFQRGP